MPDAPAPWTTRLSAVVWWHRATPAALAVAPAPAGRRLPLTIAAFVAYAATPVGPYREIVATPFLLGGLPLPAATVPFIAVDSPASVAAGRANWALPKTLARFGGETAQGDGWSVTARVRPRGPALPFAALAADRQLDAAGAELALTIAAAGRARLARVAVTTAGDACPPWLREGVHAGLVVADARVRFGAPRRRR